MSIFFEGAGRGGELFFTEVSTDYREVPDKIHGRHWEQVTQLNYSVFLHFFFQNRDLPYAEDTDYISVLYAVHTSLLH